MIKKLPRIPFNPELDFTESFLAKDCSVPFLLKYKPGLEDLIKELDCFLPSKNFLTIDYYEQVLSSGTKTCKNINWHVDGMDNDYLIVSWGDFRTEFLTADYPLDPNLTLIERNLSIVKELKGQAPSSFELSPGCPVIYDSTQIHRGRKANRDGKRILLRLCRSDYLNPKNKLFSPKPQPRQITA